MKANNCKLVISIHDKKVEVAAENASQVEIFEMCGFLQVYIGQEAIKHGMNIEDIKDNLLGMHLAAMELLNGGG